MTVEWRALLDDVDQLCGALHVLADAADHRGDRDARGALRLLARHGEAISERIERLVKAEP